MECHVQLLRMGLTCTCRFWGFDFTPIPGKAIDPLDYADSFLSQANPVSASSLFRLDRCLPFVQFAVNIKPRSGAHADLVRAEGTAALEDMEHLYVD